MLDGMKIGHRRTIRQVAMCRTAESEGLGEAAVPLSPQMLPFRCLDDVPESRRSACHSERGALAPLNVRN
jgi:hypothetical protein